jgi:hypothetical protein
VTTQTQEKTQSAPARQAPLNDWSEAAPTPGSPQAPASVGSSGEPPVQRGDWIALVVWVVCFALLASMNLFDLASCAIRSLTGTQGMIRLDDGSTLVNGRHQPAEVSGQDQEAP